MHEYFESASSELNSSKSETALMQRLTTLHGTSFSDQTAVTPCYFARPNTSFLFSERIRVLTIMVYVNKVLRKAQYRISAV